MSTLDPVTLEVIRNALPAVANEMAANLQRTSYNMMIYEVRDFCTALVGTDGALISQNVGGVSHFVADLGVIVIDGLKRYGKQGFKPGDVVITNHQAVAGQHLNNVVIYAPYFYKGELLMFVMVRAHWIDVGGMSTGFGAGPTVADPWMEGLQLDQLKIHEAGVLNETLYRVLRDNIRFPESSLGDMKSQMAACRLAARRMDELFDKYGRDTILAAIAQIFEETEQKCRNVVSGLADGVYEAEASLDEDGVTPGDPVRVHARVTIDKGAMTIDLSGCSGERKAAINSRTLAGARVAYKALTGPLDPVNEGSFRGAYRDHPRRQHHDGAFSAPIDLSSSFRRSFARRGAGEGIPRWSRPAIGRRRRRSSASTQDCALWCRVWKEAGGAAGRLRTANPAPYRSARAMSAMAPSKASSSNVRCWWRRARCAPIPAVPASTAAASASTCGCATWWKGNGISSRRGGANARPGGCGAAGPANTALIFCGYLMQVSFGRWREATISCP